MITPVIQEATEAPQPIIPPPPTDRKSRSGLIIGLVVAGVILLPVILLGAGMIALRAGGEEVLVEQFGPADGEEFDLNQDFDMEMGVEIVLESGPTITLPDSVLPGQDRGVVEGSVLKVATITSPDGPTDLYRYQSILLDSATQETMDCLGLAQGFSGSGSCRNTDQTQPLLFWGTEDRSSGTWYSVAVAGLPLEATRLVTETGSGRSVVSDIVNGVAYQEWPAGEGSNGGLFPNGGREFGEAVRTVALDSQGVVLWSEFGAN